MTSIEATMGIM